MVLDIPHKDDGTEYSIDDLFPDQRDVVLVIMNTIHEFMTLEDLRHFKPLRITVNGQGGSGKSVVINTLVTLLRQMFGFNDVVKVIAPTGVAAFNVNGETFHHFFHMGVSGKEYTANTMTKTTRAKLIQKFKTMLALIIDERSLVNSKTLGTAEVFASETMHGGCYHPLDSWGGLPVVVMVGDDYQLPGIGEGPFTALFNRYGSKMIYNGRTRLLECTDFVMELSRSKRVTGAETKTRALLDRLRVGMPNDEDISKLMSLHLDNIKLTHGHDYVRAIEDRAMFLFFKNKKRIDHNMQQLFLRASKTHPVAVMKSRTNGRAMGKAIRSHFDADLPSASVFCEGSKVAINSRNFKPSWGLHNGACGTAIEIVFAKGHSPNNGDLPLYTVVDFPLYNGPIWDRQNPTVRELGICGCIPFNLLLTTPSIQHVPIPTERFMCQKQCCERMFCPLTVAYARTIHKFQGLTAGPVPEGQPKNLYDVLVCDVDEKSFEGIALGLLYTAVSRGTTLGDETGIGSAVYFKGSTFTPDRIRNLTCKIGTNEEFKKATARRYWVNHIERNRDRSVPRVNEILVNAQAIHDWATTTRYTYDTLYHRISIYKHRIPTS